MHIRFDDTITIYNKTDQETWTRTVVRGVQWSDHEEKTIIDGRLSVARYANITFVKGSYENLTLDPRREEDAIVYGEVSDTVTTTKGQRIGDLLNKYQKAGRIKSVNDNSNREFLKNIKVVVC